MKPAKPNLSPLIILTIGAILLTWITPYSSVAIAQISLIPAPNLPEAQPINLLTADTPTLPDAVKTAVLNDAVKRTSKTVSTMQIVKAQPQQWSDGCLGLGRPEEICTQAITPGWQVIVSDGLRNWTYRTDETADRVRLEELVGS